MSYSPFNHTVYYRQQTLSKRSKRIFYLWRHFGIQPAIDEAVSFQIFNVSVSTFGEISGMALPMALKRVLSFSESTHKINKDHFPENLDIILRTGQALTSVYFFYFLATVSCSFSIIVTLK